MKIIIASDSFKGSYSSLEVAIAIEKGVRKVYPQAEIIKIPIADGGEGTVETLVINADGKYETAEVIGPDGKKLVAEYGILDQNTAVIETAAASGLPILKENELDPMTTTTYGTGQLIKDAVDKGYKKIYLGLGGSATNDGGVGMAQALGISFKEESGKEIDFGGGELDKIAHIDLSNKYKPLKDVEIIVMSDVFNPLCGPSGASYIYGPQKGATLEMVEQLDRNLNRYGEMLEKKLNKNILNIPGSGAAGGLGAGLIAFFDIEIKSGIETVLDIVKIDKHLLDSDLVITGEGKLDMQSVQGKVPIGIAKRAKQKNVPVIAIVGSADKHIAEIYSHGIDAVVDIIPRPMNLKEAMEDVAQLVENAAWNTMKIVNLNINPY